MGNQRATDFFGQASAMDRKDLHCAATASVAVEDPFFQDQAARGTAIGT